MLHAFHSLAPIILIIALGFTLVRFAFLSKESIQALSGIVFYVAMPALLVTKISTSTQSIANASKVTLVLACTAFLSLGIGLIFARLRGLSLSTGATLIQGGFRANLVFIGLSLITLALQPVDDSFDVETIAAIAIAPMIPLYNILAVILFTFAGKNHTRPSLRKILFRLVTNPLILAILVGFLIASFQQIALPLFIFRTTKMVGSMALPLALICVGGAIATTPLRGNRQLMVVACVIKLLICPAIALLAAYILDLSPLYRTISVVLAACPTAVSSYIMADKMEGDAGLAAGIVVTSTVASMPVIFFLLWLLPA